MSDFETELKLGFLEEAAQLLTDAEQAYLQLESEPENDRIIDQIFRVAHNLKGSSKAVGFEQVGTFSHEFENLLLKIKNKQLSATKQLVNVLLQCNDHLIKMISGLKEDLDSKFDCTDLLNQIQLALKGELQEDVPEVVENDHPGFEEEVVESEIDNVYPLETARKQEVSSPTDTPTNVAPESQLSPMGATPPTLTNANNKPGAPSQTNGGGGQGTPANDESIRVSLARLEALLNFVGEMVILQSVLREQATESSLLIKKTVHQLGKVTKEVQDISMSLRMVPLKATFQKMQRIVRDTSNTLGKKVNLVMSGEDTELDKTILEKVSDPLVHLIRNAVDHGIERPETRLANKKDETGTLLLSAYHSSGKLIIEVRDDGGGINPDFLKKKAIEKGIISPKQVLSEQEALHLIFHPGFSTKAEVTDVSGRGVGMDVVKTNIENLQGEVFVETVLNKGTTFKIILPLTLAIIDAMVVRLADNRYVVPLAHVHESVRLEQKDIKFATGLGEVLLLRGENLPLYRLSEMLVKKVPKAEANASHIALIIRTGSEAFAVLVDDILGQYQVVIKKLGNELQNIKGFSGSAILGDGKPALILEVAELANRTKRNYKTEIQPESKSESHLDSKNDIKGVAV